MTEDYDGDGQFGWQSFVLSRPESKMQYLAVQMRSAIKHATKSDFLTRAAMKELLEGTGYEIPDSEAYVDHQSMWQMPHTNKGELHWEFFEALRTYIQRNDVVILGGNDNDGDSTPSTPNGTTEDHVTKWLKGDREGTIIRQDKDWWVLFNVSNGTKIRFSFNDSAGQYLKATNPELVDIKITDYCPFGCDFCAPAGTKILTPNGSKNIEDIRAGDIVYSYDVENGQRIEDEVTVPMSRQYEGDLIEIEAENGSIMRLTPEHEVYTKRGWIKASEVQEDDEIMHF